MEGKIETSFALCFLKGISEIAPLSAMASFSGKTRNSVCPSTALLVHALERQNKPSITKSYIHLQSLKGQNLNIN